MKNSLKISFATLLVILSISGSAFAGEIVKSFEFGAGTANSVSNKRTFPVPCHRGIEGLSVTYQRKGDAGAANDVPIIVELRSPGATATEEGPVVDSESLNATLTQKVSLQTRNSGTLVVDSSPRGCSLPWIVRVKPASGTSPWVISGTIRLFYFGGSGTENVEGQETDAQGGSDTDPKRD